MEWRATHHGLVPRFAARAPVPSKFSDTLKKAGLERATSEVSTCSDSSSAVSSDEAPLAAETRDLQRREADADVDVGIRYMKWAASQMHLVKCQKDVRTMPCTHHKLAILTAGRAQPSFRTERPRFAPAWEQGVGGVLSGYVYRGSNERVGPGSYESHHKDRFGSLASMGARGRTLWHNHLYDH